ncbi:CopD family protein [Fontivita pretiosa]|uniref:CopD family protein n=1 Tax=Fontivita pretiosa TaxID=2989684 RepID=UPI003D173C14
MYGIILLLHVLGATVWTGGHLVLALVVLPRAIKNRSPEELRRFESGYERIGIPALLLQVATGLWLAYRMVPDITQWLALADNPLSRPIFLKLTLLLLTVILAADARLRIIPKLSERNLTALAWHIIPVTVLSVLFVAAGVSFRTGWLFF